MYLSVIAICALGVGLAASQASQTFQSRPDLRPPILNFSIYDESKVSPGYILLSPFTAPPGGNLNAGSSTTMSASQDIELLENAIQNGPYIFDYTGELIFSGYGIGGGEYTHDVKVVQQNGSSYLTYFNGDDPTAGSRGMGIVMDSSYRVVDTIISGNGKAGNDIHEFTILPNTNTALITIFEPTHYNLQSVGLDQPWGYVVQGVFQEIEVATGNVKFEWQAIDHVDPFQSYHPYNLTDPTGNGSTSATAWDFFHINAIDKFENGDYLISSRYMCALYRISAQTGQIVWQLGGMANQFQFQGFNATFAFQHHVRIRSETGTKATLSIFDNGSDGFVTRSNDSSAIFMEVDTANMTVTQIKQFYFPAPDLSTSQGSTQLLCNGNVFVGWGSLPRISEYSADGDCIMAASFAPDTSSFESYRAFKIPASAWTGLPESTPAIWSFSNSTSGPVDIFVSWNGATEVKRWQFWGQTDEAASATPTSIGSVPKKGFESVFRSAEYYPWTVVEALDGSGKSLGKSLAQQTFVVAGHVNQTNGA